MSSAPKASVLVIDDNPENRALAAAALEDEDYPVLSAASGEEGLALVRHESPGCVLLDVRMPGMDGFATCVRIRELPGAEEIPILFLTAQRDLGTFERALRAGGDDFLTKPLNPTELVVRVQTALSLRQMKRELREHYDLVRRQRDDLMRLQFQREQLTSFVIHDLKNPVNAVDLHAQLLLRRGELSDKSRHSVEQIRQEMRSLMRLVLNLLDISKGDEGTLKPRLEEVELKALIDNVVCEFEPQAAAGEIVIQSEIEVDSVRADADLLRRVLENLLDNAIRHAPEASRVLLSARRDERDVFVRVADQGLGIPERHRERIFERFARLDEERGVGQRSGRGLGLQFCRLAVEAHGGRIWVEDASPGTVFCVKLPLP